MNDAYTFWVGAFTAVWVVMFFGFSARQIRKAQEDAGSQPSALRSTQRSRDVFVRERDRHG